MSNPVQANEISVDIKFSVEHIDLMKVVFADIKAPAETIVQLSNLLDKIEKSVSGPCAFFLNELGFISTVLSKYQKYSIAQGRILPYLGDIMFQAINKIETEVIKLNQKPEVSEVREEESEQKV